MSNNPLARCIGTALGVVAPATAAQAQGVEASRRFASPMAHEVAASAKATDSAQIGAELPAHLGRQVVEYPSSEAPGAVIIDTPNTYLYFVLGAGKAIRYGIGVGRDGFAWSGVKAIDRKMEWPDWFPPPEMLQRQPYLPRFMAGGPGNPLGARALYLGGTEYRIHGTNQPSTIGKRVSSGCIRMLNEDVVDLYERAGIGTKVVVLSMQGGERVERHQAHTVTAHTAGFRNSNLY